MGMLPNAAVEVQYYLSYLEITFEVICRGLNGLGGRDNGYLTTFSSQCYMLADVILEWSGGGIFCLSFSWSGVKQISWRGVKKGVPSENNGAVTSLSI